MRKVPGNGAFHYAPAAGVIFTKGAGTGTGQEQFSYDFRTFFHPFVGDLIKRLNETSVAGMLAPGFLSQRDLQYVPTEYTTLGSKTGTVTVPDGDIDTSIGGPYANYNWELLYHIPVMIAVHLSNNQRFAEAQKWFHLVFDPTSTDSAQPAPQRFWRSFVFWNGASLANINTLLALLSSPGQPGKRRRHRVQRDPREPLRPVRRRPHPAERVPVVCGDEVLGQPDRLGRQPVSRRHDRNAERGDALLCARHQHPRAAPAGHAAAAGHHAARTSCSSSRPAWTRWPTRW